MVDMKRTILIISSNPIGTSSLRLDKEIRVIKDVLKKSPLRDYLNVQTEWATRTIDLQSALLRSKPWIVHFCGHGVGEAGLILEDELGASKPVSGNALQGVFSQLASAVECVLLNACYSKKQSDDIVQSINYVIGMSQDIKDKAAIAFTRGFYTALSYGKSIPQAYSHGKSQIAIECDSDRQALEKARKIIATNGSVIDPLAANSLNSASTEHLIPLLFQNASLTAFKHPWETAVSQADEASSQGTKQPNDSTATHQHQVNNFSGVTAEGNTTINFSPVQTQGGNVNISSHTAQKFGADSASDEVQQLKASIAQLEAAITATDMNPLLQSGAIAQVAQMKAELEKTEPDKSRIGQVMNALRQGLEDTAAIIEPLMTVASLLTKVLGVSLL